MSNGSAWRLAAGSGDYCGAESPSLGFVGLGSARGGVGSGARATGMPFRLVVRGMFPETSSRTAGPVEVRQRSPGCRKGHVEIEAIGRHLVVPHRVGDVGAELVPQYGMIHIAGARPILLVTVPGDVGAMALGIAGRHADCRMPQGNADFSRSVGSSENRL